MSDIIWKRSGGGALILALMLTLLLVALVLPLLLLFLPILFHHPPHSRLGLTARECSNQRRFFPARRFARAPPF